MFERIGPMELIIVAFLVMMIFGVGKLPQVGKSVGHGLKEFRDAVSGKEDDDRKEELAAVETAATKKQ